MNIVVKKLAAQEIESLGVYDWPVWTKEISTFGWFYDTQEMCLFLEGKVIVKTDSGEVEINQGDFAVFPEGLKCTWDIREPVKKHYKFG